MVQLSTMPTARRADPSLTQDAPSRLEIDLNRLEANLRSIREAVQQAAGGVPDATPDAERAAHMQAAAPTRICGVIKKDAYGLGAAQIAHRLARAGCDMLAVYSPQEAEQLIRNAVEAPLMLLMPLRTLGRTDALYRHAIAGKLHLTVHDVDQLHQLEHVGRTFGARLPVHLYVDTGMSRSGLNDEQLHRALSTLPSLRFVQVAGIYSHLACADEDADFTEQQREQFDRAVADAAPALPENVMRHLANTFGTLRDPRLHMDMVRPGLGLFGYGSACMKHLPENTDAPDLRPILRWVSRVVHVQRFAAGNVVGYGATHELKRDSLLGIVPVGYGDGYPLGLGNKAQVRLLDQNDTPTHTCNVLGRVNMDQIVIDLTDAADGDPQQLMQQGVEVISADPDAPNALPRLASLAGLHCYAMLCQLSPQVPRHLVR